MKVYSPPGYIHSFTIKKISSTQPTAEFPCCSRFSPHPQWCFPPPCQNHRSVGAGQPQQLGTYFKRQAITFPSPTPPTTTLSPTLLTAPRNVHLMRLP